MQSQTTQSFCFDSTYFLTYFFIFKDIYTIMVGCGIENVNLLVSALKRHTRHVQVIVFERDDMVSGPIVNNLRSLPNFSLSFFFFQNKNSSSNVLRETTTLFILAYFFPGKYILTTQFH